MIRKTAAGTIPAMQAHVRADDFETVANDQGAFHNFAQVCFDPRSCCHIDATATGRVPGARAHQRLLTSSEIRNKYKLCVHCKWLTLHAMFVKCSAGQPEIHCSSAWGPGLANVN